MAQTAGWTGDGLFAAFELVNTSGWGILQWPLFGFFYPDIRGASGLPKSLTLFCTAAVPPLLYLAISDVPAYWSSYLVWALQFFVFTIALALIAGDGWVLARCGLRWPHLLDVHRKRYVVSILGAALLQAGIVAAVISGVLPVVLAQFGAGPNPPQHP